MKLLNDACGMAIQSPSVAPENAANYARDILNAYEAVRQEIGSIATLKAQLEKAVSTLKKPSPADAVMDVAKAVSEEAGK